MTTESKTEVSTITLADGSVHAADPAVRLAQQKAAMPVALAQDGRPLGLTGFGPPANVRVGPRGLEVRTAFSDPASDRRPATAPAAMAGFEEEMVRKGAMIDPRLAEARAVVAAHEAATRQAPRALQPGFFMASAFKAEHLSGYTLPAEFAGFDFHGVAFPKGLAQCRAGGLSQATVEGMIRSERAKS
jgi:hypothetical protein